MMKKNGYYDLLLTMNDNITTNLQIVSINQEQKHIKALDNYLISQLNPILLQQLQTIKSPNAKIQFLNQLLNTFTTTQFSSNILLQVNDKPLSLIAPIKYQNNIRLSDNALFTNDNAQTLINQLQEEITTCDEVYFIYPFISNSFINKLRCAFTFAFNHNIPIHFITTTFDDMALFVNLFTLVKLIKQFPNIKIKVENNLEKKSQRIHIKAAIFKRNSGFSTIIMGSSNLTTSGMMHGRE